MTYVYDANGNIVSKTPYTNVTSSDLSAAVQGETITYSYTDANWSDKLTSYNGQAISYDASGNPTSYKGDTVTWNGRLMTSYTNSERHFEYAYNSDGMRTLKKVYENGELVYTEIYVWDGDVLLANKVIFTDGKDPVTARYLYDESGELYGMDYNGMGIFAYLKNLQGDIVSIVSLGEDDSTEVQLEYDAWGKPIFKQGSNAFGLVLIALVNSVSYRGYFYDYDTGLYYLRSRYYDPETGRFINADDTDYLGYDNLPLGMNLFAYCENNPVNSTDYSGYYYAIINPNANINSMVNTAKNLSIRSGMIRISYLNQSKYVPGKGFVNYRMPTKAYSKYIQQNRGNILYLIYTRSDGVGTFEKPFFATATVHQWNSYIVKKYASRIDKAQKAIWGFIKKNAKKLGLNVSEKTFGYFLSDLSDYIGDSLTENELLTTAAFAYNLISCVIAVVDYIQRNWWTKKDQYIYNTIKPYVAKKNWNTRIMILMCVHNFRYTAGNWRYYNSTCPY